MFASWKVAVIELPYVSWLPNRAIMNRWPSESNSQSPATLPSCHRPVPSLPICPKIAGMGPGFMAIQIIGVSENGDKWGMPLTCGKKKLWRKSSEASEIFLLCKSSNPKKCGAGGASLPDPLLRTSAKGGWASALMRFDSVMWSVLIKYWNSVEFLKASSLMKIRLLKWRTGKSYSSLFLHLLYTMR